MWLGRRQWQPIPVLLPGKFHGWKSQIGCSPWGRYKSDTTEWLPFHFSLSCIGEGNGNPLQYSCLENPRDRWAWWAAVYGITQSRTRLKQLSSSSSSNVTGAIYLLFSISMLGTYWPKEFIFQCHISLPFHTVHGVLKARTLKWFVLSLSRGQCFVRSLHHDLPFLGGTTWHGS